VEGNLLIRLLIAFVIGFYLVKNNSSKRGLDFGLIKQSIVYLGASVLLTFSMLSSLLLPLLFFGLSFLFSRYSNLDQQKGLKFSAVLIFLQVIFIIVFWLIEIKGFSRVLPTLNGVVLDFKIVLIGFSYLLVMQPVGAVVALGLSSIKKVTGITQSDDAENENGGKLIGVYERIIILTFVLLNQYEAIGFLITGKSIIRFSTNSEQLRSEYVLVGTMMSYALSILLGILVNCLLTASLMR
jgi:hypothetical protein